jgi:hypothetical protein
MRRLCQSVCTFALGLSLSGGFAWSAQPGASGGAIGPNSNCPPRYTPAPYCPQPQPSTTPTPVAPEQPPPIEPGPLAETALAPERALALGGETFAAAPNMIGDFSGRFVTTRVTQPVVVRLSAPQVPNVAFFAPAGFNAQVKIPFASSGAFKIADNESPRPQDRLFATYNYFNDVFTGPQPVGVATPGVAPTVAALANFGIPNATGPLGPNAALIFQNIRAFAGAQPALYDQYLRAIISEGRLLNFTNAPPQVQALANQIRAQLSPGLLATVQAIQLPPNAFQIVSGGPFAGTTPTRVSFPQTNLHQEVFGFEKTLLDGYASFGLRAPIFQIQGDGSLSRSDFGDLSIVVKCALFNNTMTGNVLSTGLVVTVPTGPDFTLPDGSSLHPVILQPFVGGILNLDRFYVHGFTSLAVPTDSRDALLLFNDLGIGYRLYQSRDRAILRYVIPTFETHINTPLNHRGSQHFGVSALDEVVFTYGVHLGVCRQAQLTLGVATPVTGPLPYDLEAFAQFNWRF